jgi:hypothetical protein
MIVAFGSSLKYRPSSEPADCQFMRKTSLSARDVTAQQRVETFVKQTKRPARRAGRFMWPPLVIVGLAAAGPDQGVGLGVFVVEEVGVDRSVEARIIELDREIIAALAGALGPDGSDLGFMRS